MHPFPRTLRAISAPSNLLLRNPKKNPMVTRRSFAIALAEHHQRGFPSFSSSLLVLRCLLSTVIHLVFVFPAVRRRHNEGHSWRTDAPLKEPRLRELACSPGKRSGLRCVYVEPAFPAHPPLLLHDWPPCKWRRLPSHFRPFPPVRAHGLHLGHVARFAYGVSVFLNTAVVATPPGNNSS